MKNEAHVDNTIRVEFTKIDRIINSIEDMLCIQDGLAQLADTKLEGLHFRNQLSKYAFELEKAARFFHSEMMSLRMIPIRHIFNRLNMLVHETAKQCGKNVEIEFRGEETVIDKRVAERLIDPLTHIMRNAIDHGIEKPEERIASGKPAKGKIILEATQEAGYVMINVSDDGQGLNINKIRAKAEKNGLLRPDEMVPEKQLYKIIFMPGFSTAEQVSNISGRGVGMDVVQNAIWALKGDVDVVSAAGEGSSFRLKIPLTLVMVDAFIVRVGEHKFGIPVDEVEDTVLLQAGKTLPEEMSLPHRADQPLSLQSLRKILKLDPGEYQPHWPVLIMKTMLANIGLIVDEFLGEEKIKLKQISKALPLKPMIGGAGITGNGEMILMLDAKHLGIEA